jgi:NADPH:quinone reductase-like Zn-dependent oxidoreductase
VEADLFHGGMTKANVGPISKPVSDIQSVAHRRRPGADEGHLMSQTLSPGPVRADQAQSQQVALEGRAVVIVGSTSGIGLAAATQAKAAGAKVIVIGLERDRARQVAAENGFDGGRAADVTRPETIQEALKDIPCVDHLAMLPGTSLIAPQGRVGLIDDPEPLDLRPMKMKSVSIYWESVFTRPMFGTADMVRQHEILTKMAGLVDRGAVRATAAQSLGVINAANLRRAHAVEAGRVVGKLVLAGF